MKLSHKILVLILSCTLLTTALQAQVDWHVIPPPTDLTLDKIHYLDHDNIWVSGEAGTIFYSNDLGQSWTQVESGTDKNIVEATKLLGVSRATLYRKLEQYSIER